MIESPKNIAVIGGGAAGYFAAISAKTHHPLANVTIFEKSTKVLAKVKVSGGGRCNVTHDETNIKKLASHYPRGEKFLRKAFSQFSVTDTVAWFKDKGVELKTENDHRMFPESNSSQTIIDTFLDEIKRLGIQLKTEMVFTTITETENGLKLGFLDKEDTLFDAVIVTIGGQKTIEKFEAFKQLGHQIETPVPSLFTFNITDSKLPQLMGVVAPNAQVKIQGTKLLNTGSLLVTHWGVSGPAVLKLSSLAARDLANKNYHFKIQINWMGEVKEDEVRTTLTQFITQNGKKQLNKNPFDIPNKLWAFFVAESGLKDDMRWSEVDKKSKNRFVNRILNDEYQINKKTTFKEEFVICGGISLRDVSPKTMGSKHVKGLYFAGEFLDIDGVTGGFNFQAAWTTGFIAGKLA